MKGKRYKLVLRYYGKVRDVEILVDNPELVRIVAFPTPEEGLSDAIAVYEFVEVGEHEEIV